MDKQRQDHEPKRNHELPGTFSGRDLFPPREGTVQGIPGNVSHISEFGLNNSNYDMPPAGLVPKNFSDLETDPQAQASTTEYLKKTDEQLGPDHVFILRSGPEARALLDANYIFDVLHTLGKDTRELGTQLPILQFIDKELRTQLVATGDLFKLKKLLDSLQDGVPADPTQIAVAEEMIRTYDMQLAKLSIVLQLLPTLADAFERLEQIDVPKSFRQKILHRFLGGGRQHTTFSGRRQQRHEARVERVKVEIANEQRDEVLFRVGEIYRLLGHQPEHIRGSLTNLEQLLQGISRSIFNRETKKDVELKMVGLDEFVRSFDANAHPELVPLWQHIKKTTADAHTVLGLAKDTPEAGWPPELTHPPAT